MWNNKEYLFDLGKRRTTRMTTTTSTMLPSSSTNDNGTYSDTIEFSLIPIMIEGLVLLLAAIYVMVVLIVHRVRSDRTRIQEVMAASGSVKIKKTAGSNPWLNNLSLIASICSFLNCVSNLPTLFTNNIAREVCQAMQLLSYIFYASGHVTVYLFLWKRQRTCYKNPSLAQMLNKFSRVVSAVIMPVFVASNISGVVLTAVLWEFNTGDSGCIETKKSKIPLIVLFAGSTAMQFTLLGLFIYPLKRHTTLLLERSAISSTDRHLTNLVKRSIFATGLCFAADTSAFILAMCLDPNLPSIYTNFIYDANLICNVVCVIGSFADWRRRLGPCCAPKPTQNNKYFSSIRHSNNATSV